MYHKIMIGQECYGITNDLQAARAIIDMHKNTKSGHKKDTKISTLNLTVETVPGDYPPAVAPKIELKYKGGRFPASGEYK